ncbi:MAG: MCE family protein [Candidatus Cloacimonetes bacterium]|nr:MCE family protein [Candidatus Cloacimonadota bacterium]
MKFKFKHTDKIVGIFFFVAVMALIFTLVVVAISKRIFDRKYYFLTQFVDATGLSNSTKLFFKGYEIGKLKKYSLNINNQIDAELIVYKEFRNKIVENSAIFKATNPVTGRSTMEFLQGPDWSKVLAEGEFIPSLDTPEGKRLLKEGFVKKSGDMMESVLKNVDQLLYNLTQDDNPEQGALFRMVYNLANMTDKMDVSLENINSILTSLQKDNNPEDGALFRILSNVADLTDDFKGTAAQLDEMLANYKDPDDLAVKLIDPSRENLIYPMRDMLLTLNQNLVSMNKILDFMYQQMPEFADIVAKSKISLQTAQKTLEALNNNPFLRGGIKEEAPTQQKNTKIRLMDLDQ